MRHTHRTAYEAISIHALREESDTRPIYYVRYSAISIHALREESDLSKQVRGCRQSDFNPRSP